MLAVQSEGSFIGFEGEKAVSFTGGGWCVQRTIGASAESEGLLRFWLDCTSGASKGDVTVDAGERIFFSTGVWDDAEEVRRMVRSRDELDAKDKGKAADAETPKSALEQVPIVPPPPDPNPNPNPNLKPLTLTLTLTLTQTRTRCPAWRRS